MGWEDDYKELTGVEYKRSKKKTEGKPTTYDKQAAEARAQFKAGDITEEELNAKLRGRPTPKPSGDKLDSLSYDAQSGALNRSKMIETNADTTGIGGAVNNAWDLYREEYLKRHGKKKYNVPVRTPEELTALYPNSAGTKKKTAEELADEFLKKKGLKF